MLIAKFLNHDIKTEILDLEKKYGVTFPAQYKCFLEKYNGGYTPKTNFKVRGISSDVKGFFGIGDTKLSLKDFERQGWIEKELFPIACDSFGNYIVIGLQNDSFGKIYFCDHDKGYNKEYISENLYEFLKYCKSEKISDASRRSIKEREDVLIKKGRGNIVTDDLKKMWQAEIDKYGDMVQEEVSID